MAAWVLNGLIKKVHLKKPHPHNSISISLKLVPVVQLNDLLFKSTNPVLILLVHRSTGLGVFLPRTVSRTLVVVIVLPPMWGNIKSLYDQMNIILVYGSTSGRQDS